MGYVTVQCCGTYTRSQSQAKDGSNKDPDWSVSLSDDLATCISVVAGNPGTNSVRNCDLLVNASSKTLVVYMSVAYHRSIREQ
jgi:hypothetical protein